MPKQLLQGGRRQEPAADRVRAAGRDRSGEQMLVCTGADYADVAAELPELKPANILGEPEGRDSLNAVAWPAAVLAARDPDAVIAVVTSDQLMHPVRISRARWWRASRSPRAARLLVTFGVVPTSPHTGYGYLQAGRSSRVIQTFSRYRIQGEARSWPRPRSIWPRASTGGIGRVRLARPRPSLVSRSAPARERTAAVMGVCRRTPYRLAEIYPQPAQDQRRLRRGGASLAGRGECSELSPCGCRSAGTTSAGSRLLGEQLPRDEHGNATPGSSVLVNTRDDLVINHAEPAGRCGRWPDRHRHRSDPADHPRLPDALRRNGSRNWLQEVNQRSSAADTRNRQDHRHLSVSGRLRQPPPLTIESPGCLGAVGFGRARDRILGHEILDRRSADFACTPAGRPAAGQRCLDHSGSAVQRVIMMLLPAGNPAPSASDHGAAMNLSAGS